MHAQKFSRNDVQLLNKYQSARQDILDPEVLRDAEELDKKAALIFSPFFVKGLNSEEEITGYMEEIESWAQSPVIELPMATMSGGRPALVYAALVDKDQAQERRQAKREREIAALTAEFLDFGFAEGEEEDGEAQEGQAE